MTHHVTDVTKAPRRKMLLGGQIINHGSADGAWRWPGNTPGLHYDLDAMTHIARVAEQGKFQLIFIADHPAMREDISHSPPTATIEPLVITSHLIGQTKHLGFALTQSTTFNFPYTVARQMKALDVLSGGRIGWNAVTTNDPTIGANYGSHIDDRETRYARAHEFIQLVKALWDSWGKDALKLDVERGIYADVSQIQPINLGGQFVASRGPLPTPPSPQGQPIIFQAGGGAEGLQLAGMYASGVYSMVTDIATGRAHRQALDRAALAAGRDPSAVKLFMGIFTTVAETEEAALARREALLQFASIPLAAKLHHLSVLVGMRLTMDTMREPLSADRLAALRPNFSYPHAERATKLLQDGKSPYEVLLRDVTGFHTTVIGSPTQVADQLQELFEAGAADGFFIMPDVISDGLPAFVEGVVPILQSRGLFQSDYEGSTLRENFEATSSLATA
ncbi:FMN-dependent oxidoreductase (nitrilotriacetate monooxygenase family) [Rhizobium aquaticum]|uniref:FMN-dependent oxidoreductase (Nitrilotriacetate monooxygenase family) n=1 Tax=Rhizobium aquaticum TaxID=1549636 RepID=A0ABV2J646_9HYPH